MTERDKKQIGTGKEIFPFTRSICSIKLAKDGKIDSKKSSEYDCFSKEELLSMVEEYNYLQSKGESYAIKQGYLESLVKTFINGGINARGKTKKEIINILEKRFRFNDKKICHDKTSACVLSLVHKNRQLYNTLEKNLNPVGPLKKKDDWLSNFDIDAVMKKVMEIYPDFLYLGTVPIDFATVPTGTLLDKFNIQKFLDTTSYRRFGIVFNTDTSEGSGIHWISIFIDATTLPDTISIEFFDSVAPKRFGKRVGQRQIKEFMDKFEKEVKEKVVSCLDKICKKPIIHRKFNVNEKQYKNSECGVYSLWFISSRLAHTSFDEIENMSAPDSIINWGRSTFFRGYMRKFS